MPPHVTGTPTSLPKALVLLSLLGFLSSSASTSTPPPAPPHSHNASLPNILFILVDDLGYGDLSVPPFTGHGIQTPHLEEMSRQSTILTNFHVTAPICTPSRASLLTGVFPWRLGIYSIYGSGPQAEEHLAVTPNSPMAFLAAGYHTAHVGKWHLGGMRPKDLEMRLAKKCTEAAPGPTQHGFAEYVSMAEGTGSPRLTTLIPAKKLYHKGGEWLVRNDRPHPLPPSSSSSSSSPVVLTDHQTDEAIRIMTESSKRNQPFYLHVWYDAPHGPWEVIEPYDKLYRAQASKWPGTRNFPYATMVSSVDANIGRLRKALDTLGIAENTLVVFLSDNGPEELAGSAGPFKGRKRSLQEGGIRVPCMWQWKGKITPNKRLGTFALATDLFPTFLAAAGLAIPKGYRLDGASLLDILVPASANSAGSGSTGAQHQLQQQQQQLSQRTALWHKDIEGRESAAWSHGFKLLVHGGGSTNTGPGSRPDKLMLTAGPIDLYDMLVDDRENRPLQTGGQLSPITTTTTTTTTTTASASATATTTNQSAALSGAARSDPRHLARVKLHLLDKLAAFVQQGNRPYALHKDTRRCTAPNPQDVAALPWDAASPAALPEF